VGQDNIRHGPEWGESELTKRAKGNDMKPHPQFPDDSRLWAALQNVSGGTWGGCVFDVDLIIETLNKGKKAASGES
jgi:hypothetical protein